MLSLKLIKRRDDLQKKLIPSLIKGINMRNLHEAMGDEMVQIIEDRFLNSKDPEGNAWTPIKDYVYRGTQRSAGDPPLRFHTLYKSFGFDAGKSEVRVGTPIEYAKFHTNFPDNNGGKRRVIPLREFMGIATEADYNRILDVVDDFVEKILP